MPGLARLAATPRAETMPSRSHCRWYGTTFLLEEAAHLVAEHLVVGVVDGARAGQAGAARGGDGVHGGSSGHSFRRWRGRRGARRSRRRRSRHPAARPRYARRAAAAGCRARPGCALKRGAGPGCTTPSRVAKVPRAALCGCARRFLHVQHRRDAGIGAGEQRRPVVPGAGQEDAGELRLQPRPGGRRHAVGEILGVEAELLAEQGEELRLDRPDREPARHRRMHRCRTRARRRPAC